MRTSVAFLAAVAAIIAGLGLFARPGEHRQVDGRIVVVRGGERPLAPPGPPGLPSQAAHSEPVAWEPSPAAASNDLDLDDGDPGVWATPAEFDQPEPAD